MDASGNTLKERDIKSFRIDQSVLQSILNKLIAANKDAQDYDVSLQKNNSKKDDLLVTMQVWGKDGEFNVVKSITDLRAFPWPRRIKMTTISIVR